MSDNIPEDSYLDMFLDGDFAVPPFQDSDAFNFSPEWQDTAVADCAAANPPSELLANLPPMSLDGLNVIGHQDSESIGSGTTPSDYPTPEEDTNGELLQGTIDTIDTQWLSDSALSPIASPRETYTEGMQPPGPLYPHDATQDDLHWILSALGSPSNRYPCDFPGCNKDFGKSNDKKRHYTNVHRNPDNKGEFKCPCSPDSAPRMRKDNYLRHHYGTKKQRDRCLKVPENVSPETPFECGCGVVHCSVRQHLHHVKKCTAVHHGPSGRPRGT